MQHRSKGTLWSRPLRSAIPLAIAAITVPRLAIASESNNANIEITEVTSSAGRGPADYDHPSDFPKYDVQPSWFNLAEDEMTDDARLDRKAIEITMAPVVRRQVAALLSQRTGREIHLDNVRVLSDESTTDDTMEGQIAWQVDLPEGLSWKGRCKVRKARGLSGFFFGLPMKAHPTTDEESIQIDYRTRQAATLQTAQEERIDARLQRQAALDTAWAKNEALIREQFDDWLDSLDLELVYDTDLERVDVGDLDRLHVEVTAWAKRRLDRSFPWWRATHIFEGHFSIEIPTDMKNVELARERLGLPENNPPVLRVRPTTWARRLLHRGRLYRMPGQ